MRSTADIQRELDRLQRLCEQAAAMHNTTEYARLDARREALQWALSGPAPDRSEAD
jgi:predicted nucleic acid-binding Zn ribbon protein